MGKLNVLFIGAAYNFGLVCINDLLGVCSTRMQTANEGNESTSALTDLRLSCLKLEQQLPHFDRTG